MSNMNDDVDRCIAALQAIQLIRDYYASGPEGIERVKDVIHMLAAGDSDKGKYGGLRKNVADAISKAYLLKSLEN